MNEASKATETLNLRIGNGAKIHLISPELPDSPLCGGVTTNGRRQARRKTVAPVTCAKCIEKA